MPLIIKGNKELKIVSKSEMKDILNNVKTSSTEETLKRLSPEVAERRRETLANKSARQNAELIEKSISIENTKKLESEKQQITIAVEEKVKDAVVETVTPITIDKTETSLIVDTKNDKKVSDIVDFESMTKKQIDVWADENLGVQLDRRRTKTDMIKELKKHM